MVGWKNLLGVQLEVLMRKNRESGKAMRMSMTQARLRVAGAEDPVKKGAAGVRFESDGA